VVHTDAPLPGITPPPPAGIPSAEVNVKTWHFAFNRLDDLPEILLQGREREFLTWLFRVKCIRPWTITSKTPICVLCAGVPVGTRRSAPMVESGRRFLSQ
jgi:hypothetical protein